MHEQCLTARVSMTHKCEPRKLTCALPTGQMVLHKEPDEAAELSTFMQSFGLHYHGCALPAAVGQVMELLLRPKPSCGLRTCLQGSSPCGPKTNHREAGSCGGSTHDKSILTGQD